MVIFKIYEQWNLDIQENLLYNDIYHNAQDFPSAKRIIFGFSIFLVLQNFLLFKFSFLKREKKCPNVPFSEIFLEPSAEST